MNDNMDENKKVTEVKETETPVNTSIEKKETKQEKKKKHIKDIITLVAIVLAVFFIRDFLVAPVLVNGDSMETTLHDGDVMLLNKIGYKFNGIDRFDIVVIKTEDTLLIKRVIGLPNENIKVQDNELYINGNKVDEPFLDEGTTTDDFEYKTTDNCYFVMGDNRRVSLDSRALGCFDISKIEGTTKMTVYPFNRLGRKN